jgi:hypothetical protein
MQFYLIDGVMQEDGLYVYNMNNIEEKNFSIAPVRSRGGSLVTI